MDRNILVTYVDILEKNLYTWFKDEGEVEDFLEDEGWTIKELLDVIKINSCEELDYEQEKKNLYKKSIEEITGEIKIENKTLDKDYIIDELVKYIKYADIEINKRRGHNIVAKNAELLLERLGIE